MRGSRANRALSGFVALAAAGAVVAAGSLVPPPEPTRSDRPAATAPERGIAVAPDGAPLGASRREAVVTPAGGVRAASDEVLARPASASPAALGRAMGAAALVPLHAPELARAGFLRLRSGAPRPLEALLAAARAERAFADVEPNFVVQVTAACCEPAAPLEGEVLVPGAEALQQRTHGERSVVVALIDTGVDAEHPELVHALLPAIDVTGGDGRDPVGHGTTQAGIIAAAHDGRGPGGLAPGCRLLPIRVSGSDGSATQADLAAGIIRAAEEGARVIAIPMGARTGSSALHAAVRQAAGRGALLVAAAGNEVVHHELYPAAYPEVLSVGGADASGRRLAFSTVLAPGLDLLAPAESIPTTFPKGLAGRVGGTSVAASYTAGLAALLFSLDPELGAAEVAQVLREGGRAVPGVSDEAGVFPVRAVDPALVLARLAGPRTDLVLEEARAYPSAPRPGQPVLVRARVRNAGLMPAGGRVELRLAGEAIASASLEPLALGARAEVELTLPATSVPAKGLASIEARLAAGDADASNDRRLVVLGLERGAYADVAFARPGAIRLDAERGGVSVDLVLENRGNEAATVRVSADDTHGEASARFVDADAARDRARARLLPGERRTVVVSVARRADAPRQVARLRAAAWVEGAIDKRPGDNACGVDWSLPAVGATRATPQYQQAGQVDFIVDAPFRVGPGRTYVPVLIWLPAKGDPDPATHVGLDRVRLLTRGPNDARAAGQVIYEDTDTAAPSASPPGLAILDEDLAPTGSLDAFKGLKVDRAGHYEIWRVPTDALGVTSPVATDAIKKLDVEIEWSNVRFGFNGQLTTVTGKHAKGLRIVFASRPLPELGEGRYYDAHVHTIAEWFSDQRMGVLSPRKAYGGPIPMIQESAFAIGMIPSVQATVDRLAAADHNCFYNTQIPTPDDEFMRPPFGPTSPQRSVRGGVVIPELDRMRELFGRTAGEEATFSASITVGGFPIVPLGAHMLVYGTDHIEGPWHGGSSLAAALGDPRVVELPQVLDAAVRSSGTPFLYVAHPNSSGLGWEPKHKDRALGLGSHKGDPSYVRPGGEGFVYKGPQIWNGRSPRSQPSSSIDFDDAFPWDDPDFQTGSRGWDGRVVTDLVEYHQDAAQLMRYELSNRPGVIFPRKHFIVAGTDAHGDFNFGEGRAMTILSLQATYSTDDGAFGAVRTYVLGEGRPEATEDDRAVSAFASGGSVVTDGPLIAFDVDANGRFDSQALRWHDADVQAEDRDGRMGGGGAFDGAGTALVIADDDATVLRYRYADSAEGGSQSGRVQHVKLYRTRLGEPSPKKTRSGSTEQPLGVNDLATPGAGAVIEHVLDDAKEGRITKPTLFQLAAFTGSKDPDVDVIDFDERRCYTNPVWLSPVEVDFDLRQVDQAKGEIPAGGLQVTFRFAQTVEARTYGIHVKALDGSGRSSDRLTGPVAMMTEVGGWAPNGGALDASYTVENDRPIPLNLDRYPAGSDQVTLVVYWFDAPRDAFGNPLNPIAATFSTRGIGTGGGTGPAISLPGTGGSVGGGGGGGGGGCQAAPTGAPTPWPLVLLLLALTGWTTRRREA